LKTILFVSSNEGKIDEVKKHLRNFGIEVVGKVDDIIEMNSDSQEEVAKEKARSTAEKFGEAVITEDTGIYFDAFENFPGVHTKFIINTIGYEGVLKLLKNENRGAYFKTVVAYCEPKSEPRVFSGVCKGRVTEKVFGEPVFKLPYDSIFIADGESRTFSQMTKEEKAKYSHRAKASEAFAKWFNSK
jgi:XTP/dITP diphosphohydrolase